MSRDYTLGVRLSPEEREGLENAAVVRGSPLSQLVREAIRLWLTEFAEVERLRAERRKLDTPTLNRVD